MRVVSVCTGDYLVLLLDVCHVVLNSKHITKKLKKFNKNPLKKRRKNTVQSTNVKFKLQSKLWAIIIMNF